MTLRQGQARSSSASKRPRWRRASAGRHPGGSSPTTSAEPPTGDFENDPNVTDKKFPGNPTRSYRSQDPLRVIGEVADWTRLTPEALQAWRERLAVIEASGGEIIN